MNREHTWYVHVFKPYFHHDPAVVRACYGHPRTQIFPDSKSARDLSTNIRLLIEKVQQMFEVKNYLYQKSTSDF